MKTINTFEGGQNQDIAYTKYKPNQYYDAKNFQIITEGGNSTGVLETVKGTAVLFELDGKTFTSVHMDGYTYIFHRTGDYDYIIKMDLSDSNLDGSVMSLNTSSAYYFASSPAHTWGGVVFKGKMGWDNNVTIKAIGNSENSSVKKLYWQETYSDGTKKYRHINTIYNAEINDLENLSVNQLEIISEVTLTEPTVTDVITGSLKTGAYQYAYQLYNVNGTQTPFSPMSRLWHLTTSNQSNYKTFEGSETDENTGKGLKGTVNIADTGFTRIRIISIKYTTFSGVPEVNIIEEKSINGTGDLTFTDTGNSLGNLNAEEILVFNNKFVKPETIAVKDNVMLLANVSENYFDIDNWIADNDSSNSGYVTDSDGDSFWDARAYRFRTSDDLSAVYNEAGSWMYVGLRGSFAGSSGTTDFTGSGLNDMSTGGRLNAGTSPITYTVKIDSEGTPDTFKWSTNGGESWNDINVSITGGEQTLNNGITITFDETTGHTLNDYWTFTAGEYTKVDTSGLYSHGLSTGDTIFVKGTTNYNGKKVVTVVDNDNFTIPDTYNGVESGYYIETVDKEHDCINVYNDFDNDGNANHAYGYQEDGSTRGGEGINISYSFGTTEKVIDASSFVGDYLDGVSQSQTVNYDSPILNPGIQGNGFNGYANPRNYSYLTVPYDEVERYGIQFIDEYGRKSFVKWIGDIRTPTPEDLNQNLVTFSGGQSKAIVLYITFSISNIPSGLSYRIIRAKKNDVDYSNKMWGYLGAVLEYQNSSPNSYRGTVSPMYEGQPANINNFYDDAGLIVREIQEFVSPDFLLSDNTTIDSNAYLKIYGRYDERYDVDEYTVSGEGEQKIAKFCKIGWISTDETGIDDYKYTPFIDSKDTAINTGYSLSGATYQYVNWIEKDDDGGDRYGAKGSCIILKPTTSSQFEGKISDEYQLPFVSIKVNNHDSRYGGSSYEDRGSTEYYPVSDFTTSSSSVVYGDHFIGFFEYIRGIASPNVGGAGDKIQNVVYFPVISRYNVNYRMGEDLFYKKNKIKYVDAFYLSEKARSVTVDNSIYNQENDLYLYNTIYSRIEGLDTAISKPFDYSAETDFSTRIYHSDVKINGEYLDTWTVFRLANKLDLDSQYGSIKDIQTFKNRAYFWQEKAFGTLLINEKEMVLSQSGGSLILSKSGILAGAHYMSYSDGTQDKTHIVITPNYIYWADSSKGKFLRFNGQNVEDLGMSRGMSSYFKSNLTGDIFLSYDGDTYSVYIHANDKVLLFNEITDTFVGRIDTIGYLTGYYQQDGDLYSFTFNEGSSGHSKFYKNNSNDNRCSLYGYNQYPTLTLFISPLGGQTYVYDVIETILENYDEDTGSFVNDLPITSVDIENSYQTATSLSTSDFVQRFRTWRCNIIRDGSNSDRLIDFYTKITITFDNTTNNKILLHNVASYFRPIMVKK